MKSREDSPSNTISPSLVQEYWFFYGKSWVLRFWLFWNFELTFLTNFRIQKFTPCVIFLAGISPWDLWIRIKRKKLVWNAARIAPQTEISIIWVQTHNFLFGNHGLSDLDFFEIIVHRDARACRPRSWCSCARWRARARAPARVVPNHASRPCAPWRAPARARVVPNHGARRLY